MTEKQVRRIAGRCRIDSVLGRGGKSVVHECYDEHIDRAVTIKLLNPHPSVDDSPQDDRLDEARSVLAGHFLRRVRAGREDGVTREAVRPVG